MTGFLKRDMTVSRRLKARLAAGEVVTLIHSSHPSPSLVERAGEHGFDAVLIDAEHGSVGRDRVEDMARAASLKGIVSILRPEGSLRHLITGYFACGIDGFMLPLVQTREQARELVDAFRIGAPSDHADRVLIVMIEHIRAIENLPALLDVEGIDAFLVAPADLAISMNESFAPLSPKVRATMDRAVETIVRAGRVCGLCVDFDTIGSCLDKGATLLYLHMDHLIARGAREYFSIVEAARRGRR